LCVDAARRIEGATVPTAKPFGALIRAGLARLEGNRGKMENELRTAITHLDFAQMAMYREAARWCLGETLGGETGKIQIEASRSWMAHEEIRRPEAIVDMLVPACRGAF
jgi:eukaryotic-like serine/threonine-protein kinase